MRCERGQAAVEWTGTLLVCVLSLAALGAAASALDGRSFAGFLAHRIVCAVKQGCDDGDRALVRAYGRSDAELVRSLAPSLVFEHGEPQLPVDWRRCREAGCATAPEGPGLDVHRSGAGGRATLFTRVVRRGGRRYLQYWIYYPDSNTAWAGSDRVWNHSAVRLIGPYPGFHRDDWESYQLRVDPDGSVWARASAHGHYQGCKGRRCRNRWQPSTGWTRVSRGSHAGHLPRRPARGERSATGEGMRLIPLETLPQRGRYRPLDPRVTPPWRKRAWDDPETPES